MIQRITLTILTTFGICLFSSAQLLKHYSEFDLEWGPLFRASGNVESLVRTTDGEYYSLVNKTNFYNLFVDYKKRYYFESVVALEPGKRMKLKLTGEGRRTNLEDLTVIGDQIALVSKENYLGSKQTRIFYHLLKPNRYGLDSEGFLIGEFPLLSARSDMSYLGLRNDLNKSKAGFFFTSRTLNDDFLNYTFGILDQNGQLTSKKESSLPFSADELQVIDSYLSTAGDYFVLTRSIDEKDRYGEGWTAERHMDIRVFKMVDGELNDLKINQSQYMLTEVNIISDKSENLIFSGLYSASPRGNVEGIFFIMTDQEGKLITREFHPFSSEFLLSNNPSWSNRGLLHFDRSGRAIEGVSDFKMHNLRQTSDGGYIAIAEHFEIEERFSGSGTPGSSNRIDTYYYYDDLLIYKLDKNGALEWKKNVPKLQSSINDGGYYLSIVQALNDSTLFILFNDNVKNYDDMNYYLNLENVRSATFTARKNTIAMVEINLRTGTEERYSLLGKKEMSTVLVPGICRENPENNELFLYSRSGKRHRYGRLIFKD
ncbi:MAG: hypothetical protein R3277_05170 [Brumimicrobium sp.]|nr:hypothetical protein [Brumimicrobium sp.]